MSNPAEILAALERILPTVSPEDRPGFMIRLAGCLSTLAAAQMKERTVDPASLGDILLNVRQAAKKLSQSTDWLYHNAAKLPFSVRNGGSLRFSSRGIDEYIRSRRRK